LETFPNVSYSLKLFISLHSKNHLKILTRTLAVAGTVRLLRESVSAKI